MKTVSYGHRYRQIAQGNQLKNPESETQTEGQEGVSLRCDRRHCRLLRAQELVSPINGVELIVIYMGKNKQP